MFFLIIFQIMCGTEATEGLASTSSNCIYPENLSADRIMQVDSMLATTSNMIMQVDGADDELEDIDEDYSETESSKSNSPTKNGTVSQNRRKSAIF